MNNFNQVLPKVNIVLNNVRSAWNVGSIMRTCDALGFGLVLIGYTPRPLGPTLNLVKKTAIGAENTVPWKYFEHWRETLENLPGKHYGIEICDFSQSIFTHISQMQADENNQRTYLWFGNEIHGLELDLLKEFEKVLHLPMLGMKESLNVSSCMCAVGYMWLYGITGKNE
jgi:23S rRNA (guanosine2251-2'-O)-methyltransferase